MFLLRAILVVCQKSINKKIGPSVLWGCLFWKWESRKCEYVGTMVENRLNPILINLMGGLFPGVVKRRPK